SAACRWARSPARSCASSEGGVDATGPMSQAIEQERHTGYDRATGRHFDAGKFWRIATPAIHQPRAWTFAHDWW
ncbi:MAG: hypothetical protein KJZ90_14960, partial [Rhodocyclaceae bacterium]|nr:hypothetical protein [Rhodocyclaceae bacterium]